ncbi:MAG: hypothetical protein P8103_17035 [Candidatus Thiodiazotropha sp.]
MTEEFPDVASAETPSTRQRLFVRYFIAILIDLVVLNLFAEYWSRVYVEAFTVSLFVAVLLQVLLKLTLAIEHRVRHYFQSMAGVKGRILRVASAWVILFLSKFVMLGLIDIAFGDNIRFDGALHGAGPFIAMLFAMLAAEEVFIRLYRRLA